MRCFMPHQLGLWAAALPLAASLSGCGKSHHGRAEPPLGEAPKLAPEQSFDLSSAAFNNPVAGLTEDEQALHDKGDRFSDVHFVPSPAPQYGGLGPYYNNSSCTSCHRSDGRGLPLLQPGTGHSQLIVKVSSTLPGTSDEPGGPVPVPGIGGQIKDQRLFSAAPGATAGLSWSEEQVTLGDGSSAARRSPQLTVTKASGEALTVADGVLTSLRLPPAVFGLGLLEAVSDQALEQNAIDSDKPGRLHGHLNQVWSRSKGAVAIGRFGRKANKALVKDQVALALAEDIGLQNSLFPGPAGETEVDDDTVSALTFYIRTLAPPLARTSGNAVAQRGKLVFQAIGCSGCHVETMHTAADASPKALADQEIHPYSDLLLHNMGPDLADHRPDFTASGEEWRTPPLWGIGLQATVLPYACYLHDGRARSLLEAVLWHGGQAQPAREAFRSLSEEARSELLAFLGSL